MAPWTVDRWSGFGSALASFLFLWSLVQSNIPDWADKLASYVNPYCQITISEHSAGPFHGNLFPAVEAYLSYTCARRARKLKADLGKGSKHVQITLDHNEEVTDDFAGATFWWYAAKNRPSSTVTINWHAAQEERRFYLLVFHRRHRDVVVNSYLPYILDKARALAVMNRQRRLFTNNPSNSWNRGKRVWSHIPFEHPATFDTIAMDPAEKEAIVDDLSAFRDAKDHYAKVGKAWKRGYLLYGPPGTGKSTMIAAMANFLDYDVYDLELTAVKSNTELRRLYIETTSKSIIVIEDIDCSVDLTDKRRPYKKRKSNNEDGNKPKLPMEPENDDETTKLTLSGLLNFIDGLWSSCGGERIIIFTTNHVEKLDPALIRRGRMDMHIKMSYCRFEAFKVLAANHLGVREHELFTGIGRLLEEVDMTPADVAESLMPRSKKRKRDAGESLADLVEALEKAKEDAAAAKALADTKAKEETEAADEVKKMKGGDHGTKDKTSDTLDGKTKTTAAANGGEKHQYVVD